MSFLPSEIIKKKRNGLELSAEEIKFFVQSYADEKIPDYQMSAFLMAVYFQGMTTAETLAITSAMLNSGTVVNLDHIPGFKVDKHSTGGVGDKTSLILGPVVRACGINVPMISGRGLGHTGGTLDKLESIPGFNTRLGLSEYVRLLETAGIAFIGQTSEICPADRKMYSLRDVTATIESFPLICGSIMSKKLAEGIDGLVLDVKYGSGAFMKTAENAEKLANSLIQIAVGYKKKVAALITDMNQPLGRYAGNALEVHECIEIMSGKSHLGRYGYDTYHDTRELSLLLSAHMILLSGKCPNITDSYALAKTKLENGEALAVFKKMCADQGGNLNSLPLPNKKIDVLSEKAGYILSMDTEKIGVAGILIQAGRSKTTDIINPVTGIEFHAKIGDLIKPGEVIFTIHGSDNTDFTSARDLLKTSYQLTNSEIKKAPLVLKTIEGGPR